MSDPPKQHGKGLGGWDCFRFIYLDYMFMCNIEIWILLCFLLFALNVWNSRLLGSCRLLRFVAACFGPCLVIVFVGMFVVWCVVYVSLPLFFVNFLILQHILYRLLLLISAIFLQCKHVTDYVILEDGF